MAMDFIQAQHQARQAAGDFLSHGQPTIDELAALLLATHMAGAAAALEMVPDVTPDEIPTMAQQLRANVEALATPAQE